ARQAEYQILPVDHELQPLAPDERHVRFVKMEYLVKKRPVAAPPIPGKSLRLETDPLPQILRTDQFTSFAFLRFTILIWRVGVDRKLKRRPSETDLLDCLSAVDLRTWLHFFVRFTKVGELFCERPADKPGRSHSNIDPAVVPFDENQPVDLCV